ncbi:MAG: aquaporin family protein [Bacteroidaceae bacterium]|nr:aquaporin family protein [Bacteroidaceae bacterium]MBR6048348.1 aquaporin family protein [Bacteroidaceae bacterium]
METTLFQQCVFEFLGTMVLVLMGDGVCAATTLNKSKAKGGGWVVVSFAWGFAVMCGVFIAGPYSGAHLNPAVSVGLAMVGTFPWASVVPYVCAQLTGGFLGAVLVWAFYKYHFDATQDNPDGMLGCFCTMPAIDKRGNNLLSEVIATFVLVFIILALGTDGNMGHAGDTPVGMGSLGAFPVTCLIIALGMSLGGTTGYAMNPARDLPPRIAHALLPIKGKRDSGWPYSWVPVVGPVLGAIIAAALYLLVY